MTHIKDNWIFLDMYDYIHLDKKWFFMTNTNQIYYLLPNKLLPICKWKSKQYIKNIMFMAAVAWPRWISQTKTWFNGFIRISPCVNKEAANKTKQQKSVQMDNGNKEYQLNWLCLTHGHDGKKCHSKFERKLVYAILWGRNIYSTRPCITTFWDKLIEKLAALDGWDIKKEKDNPPTVQISKFLI